MALGAVNVVVGIPTFGMVSIYFLQARISQQFPLVSSSIDKIVLNKPIAEARNEIVEFALAQGANYIYWLDDDVIPPPDAFMKLYRHQKDIVNGVYWSKSNPPMPLLFRGHLQGPYWKWHVGDMIEIDAAGNGLTLVKTDVYRKISETVGGPWYSTEYASFPGIKASGFNNTEDLYFYWKAKKAGFKIWADTSVQAYHYDKTNDVHYAMPPYAPQGNPAWKIDEPGTKLVADIGSGAITPYMVDQGVVVTFDIREDVRPDIVCDVRYLPVDDQTFDVVHSSHTLEHFSYQGADKVLKEWSRVLKVGGELRLVVPNMRHIGQRLVDDNLYGTDYWVAYGGQEYAKNFHAGMFTPKTLTSLVESLGIYEDIQTHEGDVFGAPNADNWNLQLKATKVKHLEVDNIAPEDMIMGPPNNTVMPIRLFDTVTERPLTPEELTDDLLWVNHLEREENRKQMVADIVTKHKTKKRKTAVKVGVENGLESGNEKPRDTDGI